MSGCDAEYIGRMDITKKTVDAIKEIAEKYKLSYSEIAVLFPYKQHDRIQLNSFR